jgi:hypothetical protein
LHKKIALIRGTIIITYIFHFVKGFLRFFEKNFFVFSNLRKLAFSNKEEVGVGGEAPHTLILKTLLKGFGSWLFYSI